MEEDQLRDVFKQGAMLKSSYIKIKEQTTSRKLMQGVHTFDILAVEASKYQFIPAIDRHFGDQWWKEWESDFVRLVVNLAFIQESIIRKMDFSEKAIK